MRAGEQVTRARDFGLTDDADVAGLGTFRALLDLVLDLGAFGEALEALAGDRAEVHEDVVTAVGLRDEAVALRVVEPLHGSGCHVFHLPAPSRTCSGGVIALPVLALDDLWREKGSAFGAVAALGGIVASSMWPGLTGRGGEAATASCAASQAML